MENNAGKINQIGMRSKGQKKIYVHEEYCVGCGLCEVYCAASHSKYKNDVVKAFKKTGRRPLPRIFFEMRKPLSFGLQCRRCEEPECVKSCITGAMRQDPETGIIVNDENRCIGCWTCVVTCPYGMIRTDNSRKIALKCDFCIDIGGEPACVANCPNEAICVADDAECLET